MSHSLFWHHIFVKMGFWWGLGSHASEFLINVSFKGAADSCPLRCRFASAGLQSQHLHLPSEVMEKHFWVARCHVSTPGEDDLFQHLRFSQSLHIYYFESWACWQLSLSFISQSNHCFPKTKQPAIHPNIVLEGRPSGGQKRTTKKITFLILKKKPR